MCKTFLHSEKLEEKITEVVGRVYFGVFGIGVCILVFLVLACVFRVFWYWRVYLVLFGIGVCILLFLVVACVFECFWYWGVYFVVFVIVVCI